MFTEEQIQLLKRLAELYDKLFEEATKTMVKRLEHAILYFDEISKLSLSYDEPIHPAARKMFLGNAFMKSQVILRKPLYTRARSSC